MCGRYLQHFPPEFSEIQNSVFSIVLRSSSHSSHKTVVVHGCSSAACHNNESGTLVTPQAGPKMFLKVSPIEHQLRLIFLQFGTFILCVYNETCCWKPFFLCVKIVLLCQNGNSLLNFRHFT